MQTEVLSTRSTNQLTIDVIYVESFHAAIMHRSRTKYRVTARPRCTDCIGAAESRKRAAVRLEFASMKTRFLERLVHGGRSGSSGEHFPRNRST